MKNKMKTHLHNDPADLRYQGFAGHPRGLSLEGRQFFFSSRGRHTSSTRDWSSDVCSSDLDELPEPSFQCGISLRTQPRRAEGCLRVEPRRRPQKRDDSDQDWNEAHRASRVLGDVLPPNGSRLSCGRSARGRKESEPQTKKLASEATQFLPTCERPPASSAC